MADYSADMSAPRNGPPGNNGPLRPNPSPNMNVRPLYPNQRPPPQQQQQQLQPSAGNPPPGRSPMMSPFQRQDQPGSTGPSPRPQHQIHQQPQQQPQQQQQQQQHHAMNPAFRPVQQSPPPSSHGSPVRPGGAPSGPGSLQQQQLPRPPAPGQGQPMQLGNPGRPQQGQIGAGGQGPQRAASNGGLNSPQTQPSPRPPQQQQPGQPSLPPNMNGGTLRPSISHPNLSGAAPGVPAGNRFTPPSPNLTTTRSPHMRPLQPPPQQQQQPHPPQHHPTLRPSSSQPHLAQQVAVRPPPSNSPSQTHTMAVRPPAQSPHQQQPRPRPPQAASHGQVPGQAPQQRTPQPVPPGHSVQLEMPPMETYGGVDPSSQRQQFSQSTPALTQQQQRPPGARPILDQMRQQASQPGQGQGPQGHTPLQRPPQKAPIPGSVNPSDTSSPLRTASRDAEHPQSGPASPPRANLNNGKPAVGHQDQNGGRVQGQVSPQSQTPNLVHQRPPNPQYQPSGPGHRQPQGPLGGAQRPLVAPGSPGQRPLGSIDIKVPGPATNIGVRPPPAAAHRQPPQSQSHPMQPQESTHEQSFSTSSNPFTEPEPPSDSDGEIQEDDDIEGGVSMMGSSMTSSGKTSPGKAVPADASPEQPAATQPPPPPKNLAAGGPPAGPPRGPPKGDGAAARKLSTSTGSGPVRIIPPSNNPSSPPASAFPPVGQPRARVRPPPGNQTFAPYKPPERPSQTPVMYGQSGQPTFSQPFPQSEGSPSDSPSGATSTVPAGMDAASSSFRPRDGGLQRRVVATDSNASKPNPVSPPSQSPPSPKLHGQKGPAILSLSNQRSSSSSTVKTLKTWMIRGGIVYLGYTALFNCPSDATGMRGLYCKATNGAGGLVKPYVAPHYNAHLGPHVDRYVKPVVRQSHRVYMKVADPVVQGVFSVAGNVYKSTAKKHVDSAKDQVISILPYPFKSKPALTQPKDSHQDNHHEELRDDHQEPAKSAEAPVKAVEAEPEHEAEFALEDDASTDQHSDSVPKHISRQPIHAEESEDHLQETTDPDVIDKIVESVEAVAESISEKLEEVVHPHPEETSELEKSSQEHHVASEEEQEPLLSEHMEKPSYPEVDHHEAVEAPEASHQEESMTAHDENGVEGHDETIVETHLVDDNKIDILDRIAAFKNSMRRSDPSWEENKEQAEVQTQEEEAIATKGEEEDQKESNPVPLEAEPVPIVEPFPETTATEHDDQLSAVTEEIPQADGQSNQEESTITSEEEIPKTAAPVEETVESTPQVADLPTETAPAPEDSNVESGTAHSEEDKTGEETVTDTVEGHGISDETTESASSQDGQQGDDVEASETAMKEEQEDHAEKPSVEQAEEQVTFEQQAAPVSEADHEEASKSHDEL